MATWWDSPQLVQWSGSSGLASPQGSRLDTVLVLGADPNTAIAEPAGKLGLFTAALLHFLPVQGLTVSEIIQSVQKEVAEKSKGDQQIYQVGTSNVYLTPENQSRRLARKREGHAHICVDTIRLLQNGLRADRSKLRQK